MTERPSDPELAAAIDLARRLSRRRFLSRMGMGAGAIALGPSLLAACGGDDGGSGGGGDGSGADQLNISNWTAYIDQSDAGDFTASGTTIDRFQQATGIRVSYKEDYNDNGEYFNKNFSPILGTGKTLAADIVVPTYWMAARIIGLGWVEELPLDDIPNHANLIDSYRDVAWDPGATRNMPWQAGITGIAWNPALTGGPLTSVNDLFDDKLKGKVAFLTELRDTVGLTMLGMGADPSEAARDDIEAALDKLEAATQSGQILKFTGNEYLSSLENGDIAACLAWSGDIFQLNPSLGIEFAIPEEGGMQWFDTMVVPKGAANVTAAAKWMDFVYEPENAAAITEYVQFLSPVQGVREVLEAKGGEAAELAESPLIFPDDETLARLSVFGDLEEEDDIELQARFNSFTG